MGLYLGIDSSTQGVKCIVIDIQSGKIAAESAVNFGNDLPQYGSPDGFLPHPDPLVRHSDPLMWVDALELALNRLAATGVDMGAICGISGTGQQHGSVYLAEEFPRYCSGKSLAGQLRPILSRRTSPIWMDRSTHAICQELNETFGDRMINTTGSPAVERFTGPQIRKFFLEDPESYKRTSRIHLVSSFMDSVL